MKKKAQQGAADEEGDGAVDVVDQVSTSLSFPLLFLFLKISK